MATVVELTWARPGLMGIMRVISGEEGEQTTDTYPVLPRRPSDVISFGPIYEYQNWRIATGVRTVGVEERPVAWVARPEEVAEIEQMLIDALASNEG